jgi:hypothetical protein
MLAIVLRTPLLTKLGRELMPPPDEPLAPPDELLLEPRAAAIKPIDPAAGADDGAGEKALPVAKGPAADGLPGSVDTRNSTFGLPAAAAAAPAELDDATPPPAEDGPAKAASGDECPRMEWHM